VLHLQHGPPGIIFLEEDDDNEELSDMEEGDADASTAKQVSRKQQVWAAAISKMARKKLSYRKILTCGENVEAVVTCFGTYS